MIILYHCEHYRGLVLEFGLWDQIRVDQGKEWILTLFIQELLAHLRIDLSRAPHVQTTSKQASFIVIRYMCAYHQCPFINLNINQNHRVERIWVEINGRLNYPLKACLIEMQARNDMDLDSDHGKFCIS